MRVHTIVVALIAACGGKGSTPPDAQSDAPGDAAPDAIVIDAPPPENPGFVDPTAPLKANQEQSPDVWVEVGPADLTCLGTPSSDQATTVPVALSTTVRDFQSQNVIPGATVNVFPAQMVGSPFAGSPYTSSASGAITVSLPVGTERFGFEITEPDQLDTLIFGTLVAPGQATQTLPAIESFSATTAQTFPALIGISRTPGTGFVLGVMRDCQGREVSNFIATVSTTAGTTDHVDGADTYYFSSSVGLPVRHSQQAVASEDGQFMVIELAPTATGFIQIWGYPTDAALAADQLMLIAELEVPVIADTVISGPHEPLRTP